MLLYREELKTKQKRVSIFEKLSKMLGKGGIQTILLDSVIDDLEITSNKILDKIPTFDSADRKRVNQVLNPINVSWGYVETELVSNKAAALRAAL